MVFVLIGTLTYAINPKNPVKKTTTSMKSTRKVLLEEFTNASCAPCAAANPAINQLILANPSKLAAIKYQTNWPGADPMNAHNPGEVDTRVGFYQVNAVPHSVIDGVSLSGHPSQSSINAAFAVPSPFIILVNHQVSAGQITVNATIKKTDLATGNLVVFIGVIEKYIHFASAPGTNGETDFYRVMKKMLPGDNGTPLNNLNIGETQTITESWTLANVYDESQLSAVVWVQSIDDREIFQAEMSEPNTSNVFALFACDNIMVAPGASANFTDESITSTGTITNWEWTFEGGTPSTFSGQTPPAISYSTVGFYDVQLIVTNDNNDKDTLLIPEYINCKIPATSEWIIQASGFATASRGAMYLSVANSNIAWAIANDGSTGDVLKEFTKTTNGGVTWTPGTISGLPTSAVPSCISAVDGSTAYISTYSSSATSGQCGVFQTVNGGTTWTKQTTATYTGTAAFPNIVHFFNANDGITQGDPNGGYFEVYTTSDGGTTWTRVPQVNLPAIAASDEYGYTNMYDAYGDNLWYATNKGRVYRSTDKGATWAVSVVPTFTDFSEIAFSDELNGMAAQITYNTSTGAITAVKIARTNDGGATWTIFTPGVGAYFSSIAAVPGVANKFVSVGYDQSGNLGSAYTENAGDTWTNIDEGVQYISVDFSDNTTGWAGGFNQIATEGGIYKWHLITKTPSLLQTDYAIYPNPSNGIISLSLKENSKIKVFNTSGTLVFETIKDSENSTIDLTSLSHGLYLVQVESNGSISSKKLIIQ